MVIWRGRDPCYMAQRLRISRPLRYGPNVHSVVRGLCQPVRRTVPLRYGPDVRSIVRGLCQLTRPSHSWYLSSWYMVVCG